MNTTTFSPQEVLKQLEWRYATKEFDSSKKIPDDVWKVLEQSLVLAPSSFGVQPWKFFVVRNPDIRHQLLEHSWGQKQVEEASHLVVLTIKEDINSEDVDSYLERMSEVRNVPVENLEKLGDMIKGFIKEPPFPLDKNEWSTRQVYIALGFFMTCAAILEIDTCPMEGIVPDKYDEVLGLKETGYHTVVVCPAGYRLPSDKYANIPKVRFKTEDVVEYVD
ncbi:NAD(P)H-dependent oxidoreductase [Plectonema cf. radiosum LEGE 06105]|uniref:NAD(P)H-dependent oxidoreductase n=1 Tax=Plectonema cf. radiosum LEGE 06105 TaxID=945769 RepID=A0A8J7K4F4_9CYAN|nr:NAD(P)H-dependent oxidoreductase [Plectonema radiosum]MBE9216232.1 NAD(P)H-dependent oxidoreductase [Plectonema cf. radiosum LEGE 06105]